MYQRADGRWCASVDLGYAGGKRRRKVIYGRTRKEVVDKLDDALRARDAGTLATRSPTLADWYAVYLPQVAAPKVRPTTLANYTSEFDRHIGPALGRVRLDKLEPAQVAAFYRAKLAEGLSAASVRLLHANLRRALNVAMKWGVVGRNVVVLVDPPPREHHEIVPFTVDEARQLLAAARGTRLEARWIVGLSLGLRQGEVLGLHWPDLDLDAGSLRVARQLQRSREGAGLVHGPLKSARSRRTLSLPPSLIAVLRRHRDEQAAERALAGDAWRGSPAAFTTPIGTPIDPRNDNRAFKALLKDAGVRPARLHDLRHTAASLLLAQGVQPRVVMDVLGHSQIALTMNTYSHVMPSLLGEAARSMESALWGDE